jgi:hypothetical protein
MIYARKANVYMICSHVIMVDAKLKDFIPFHFVWSEQNYYP